MIAFTLVSWALAAQPQASGGGPLVLFPHPLITEVLYAVPSGDENDSTGDGGRDATGDEFVELYNPHDKPIQLEGYVITDRPRGGKTSKAPATEAEDEKPATAPGKENAPKKPKSKSEKKPGDELKFVFPRLELKPGEVVVVFNGLNQTWTGPVGDSSHPPEGRHAAFHGAYVFTMRSDSSFVGFANKGDYVLLSTPKGEAVECVTWGDADGTMAGKAGRVESVPMTSRGSAQRLDPRGQFAVHPPAGGTKGDLPFSPGQFPWSPPSEGGESTPGSKPDKKPK